MASRRLPPLRPMPPANPTPLQGIPPLTQFRNNLPEYAADALQYFTQFSTVEFVKEIGNPGVQGGCWLFTERRNGSEFAGQFIVKWYNAYHDFGNSVSEYQILSLLAGPERTTHFALFFHVRCDVDTFIIIPPPLACSSRGSGKETLLRSRTTNTWRSRHRTVKRRRLFPVAHGTRSDSGIRRARQPVGPSLSVWGIWTADSREAGVADISLL